MKRIEWAEYGGAAAIGVIGDYLATSSSISSKLKDADLWGYAAVLAGDVFLGDKLHGMARGALGGAGYGATALLAQRAIQEVKTKTASTAAPADFMITSAPTPAPAMIGVGQSYGDIEGFHAE